MADAHAFAADERTRGKPITLPRMTRVERWERRFEIPLLLSALAFLVAYAWPILDPRMDPGIETFLTVVSWTVWGVFFVDFVIRLMLAEEHRRYALRHWYDVLLIVLPMLRPLRLLRILVFARFMGRSIQRNLAGRVTVYVVATAVASVALGALAVLDAERENPEANIKSFGDALWWAMTTVTTVGYGDRFPVTVQGRLIATALMIVGMALVGSITAALATWFVESARAGQNTDKDAELK
jgi:voltage-gated potassium channel